MRKLNKLITFDEHKAQLMRDPEFRKEYEALRPKFEAINSVIKARIENGLTQEELARKLKTKQSNISRFESGKVTPSLFFLQKIAQVFDKRLEIRFA